MSGYRAKINLRVMAGVAKPSPKMGQALGPLGINMMQFCKDFNAQTGHIRSDVPMRVVLVAFHDRTFKFAVKPPSTSWFIKRWVSKDKLTDYPGHIVNSAISIKYVYELAKIKQEIDPDLEFTSLESICRSIMSQCNSMGVGVGMDQEKPEKPIKLNLKL